MWRITIASLVLAVSAFAQAPAAPAQAPTICGNQPLCFEASDFAATITDFRTSLTGGYHLMDVTIRFTNKTNGLLIMGYANGSGTATDDRATHAAATRSTHARCGHQRGDLENVGYVDLGAMR